MSRTPVQRRRRGAGRQRPGPRLHRRQGQSVRFFGSDPAHRAVADTVNAAGWCVGALVAYYARFAYVGRDNEKIEPAYAAPLRAHRAGRQRQPMSHPRSACSTARCGPRGRGCACRGRPGGSSPTGSRWRSSPPPTTCSQCRADQCAQGRAEPLTRRAALPSMRCSSRPAYESSAVSAWTECWSLAHGTCRGSWGARRSPQHVPAAAT